MTSTAKQKAKQATNLKRADILTFDLLARHGAQVQSAQGEI